MDGPFIILFEINQG